MSEDTCGCGAETGSEEFLEDMPMRRYTNPIPACECTRGGHPDSCGERLSACNCRRELERILSVLECQNQLLVDLLGALNGLNAALLAGRPPYGVC